MAEPKGRSKTPPKKQRFYFFLFSMVIIAFALGLILYALRDNVSYFKTPTDLMAENVEGKTIRLGGLVKEGSYQKINATDIEFIITDLDNEQLVVYSGFVPNLFREGQGIIATGSMNYETKEFEADQILAKHDENYMPPEVHKALKEKGLAPR